MADKQHEQEEEDFGPAPAPEGVHADDESDTDQNDRAGNIQDAPPSPPKKRRKGSFPFWFHFVKSCDNVIFMFIFASKLKHFLNWTFVFCCN